MTERAFIIMQIGAKESAERKRADEIYEFVISPAVKESGLEPYRADLDYTPGAITPKMLAELLNAKIVIADLTGKNPNVFYELGITHSFARPLISIADSSKSLPFDAKDERVIELGEYSTSGLTYAQGEKAKASLSESLKVVLATDFIPPSPLREVAANRSVDQLAPEDPVAAEMAQIREGIEEIRKNLAAPEPPPALPSDLSALRAVVARNILFLDEKDFELLSSGKTSGRQKAWTEKLYQEWLKSPDRLHPGNQSAADDEPPF